ncbi:hypothetical protein I316_04746 [Kwoniella heveanensis BCC8398]|uniref:Zn(2)-C6 fungal-type domain-containing protein n=1 Tax=Kwoniella heveanensis BCC8398 TaxID=1296120 RepID=A0A1B9GRI5_9TREE|nr:hypothetical protein I316_04746 [Kwoniella heveanensis BCC8398]
MFAGNTAGPSTGGYPPPPPPPQFPRQQRQQPPQPQSSGPPPPHPPSSTRSSTFPSPKNTGTSATQSSPDKADTVDSNSTKATSVSLAPDRSSSIQAKKKRKKNGTVNKAEATVESPSEIDKDKEKRTKTGRACDACRTKKIRCDILSSDDTPPGQDSQPICAHCKQYDLECTFFLPITETRFKKKRMAEENNHSNNDVLPLAKSTLNRSAPDHRGATDSPTYEGLGGGPNSSKGDRGRVEGPTSIGFLLHTTIPAIPSEAYDLRHHSSWEVLEDGNGIIRVNAPPSGNSHADADPQDPTRAHNRLNKPVLSAHTMSLLVNAYFKEVAPLFPIISRSEFASRSSPNPLLLYSICGLGATKRQFPREVFAGVRGVINGILRSNDILSDARLENVQALLLLAQVGDLHAQPTAATASASLIRTGAAIRMAQDLGLHRESSLRAITTEDLSYVELRRRVWATCVIMDRWYGAALGIPLLIDLLDCDVLLPAPYAINSDTDPSSWPLEPSFVALTEHLKLSILIGRVLKTIYSPTGLKHATDAQLEGLVTDMEGWKAGLPDELQFKGPSSPHASGLLHLGYTGLQFLFWRVFMRITYSCPPHLTFVVQVAHWSKMIEWSRQALEWLDKNDDALDTLFIFPYAATSCALIQYHTWARRGDSEALETLKLVKETASRWEQTVQPDQMSIRRKTCETMTLLYEAALKTDPDSRENHNPSNLPANPTAGVMPRQGGFSKLVFHKDDNREGGGVFVAPDEQNRELSGLNKGDVLLASEMSTDSQSGAGKIPESAVGSSAAAISGRGATVEAQGNSVNQMQAYTDAQTQNQEDLGDQRRAADQQGRHDASVDFIQNLTRKPGNLNPQITDDGPEALPNAGNVNNLGHMMDVNPEMASHLSIPFGSQHQQQLTDQQRQHENQYLHSSSNGFPGGVGPGQPQNPMQNQTFPLDGQHQQQQHSFDPSFLDSLPVSTFDWESWSSYFDKFLPATNHFEAMQ